MTAGTSRPDRHAAVSSYFTKHATSWRDRYSEESFDAFMYRTRAAIALAWLGSPPEPQRRWVLDIGSGAGIQAGLAASQGWEVVGADFAHGMLEQASKEIRGPRWVAAAAEALPIRPGTMDAVLMLGLIGYVADPVQTLKDVSRLMSDGGRLIIDWRSPRPPILELLGTIVSAVPQWLYRRIKLLAGGRIDPPDLGDGFYHTFYRRWTAPDFTRLLETAGFRVVEVRGHNFGVFRFMGKALWSERVDVRLTRWLERMFALSPFRRILPRTQCYVAVARARAPHDATIVSKEERQLVAAGAQHEVP